MSRETPDAPDSSGAHRAEPDRGIDARIWTDGTDLAVELKSGLSSVRGLRAAILGLATRLGRQPDVRGLLLLLRPSLTPSRIARVWEEAREVLVPDVAGRLDVRTVEPGTLEEIGWLPPALAEAIAVREATERAGVKLPRPDYFIEVLKLVLQRRFGQQGPMTTKALSEAVGCSYPTTRRALDRLGPALVRHSDRRVELGHFPRRAWAELVSGSERLRGAVRFVDRSGQPRSPESLLRRLDRVERDDVAVGGAVGAALALPEIDLVGAPRLDVCVHAPGRRLDLGFVHGLDPGLEPTDDPLAPARLVVHPVRRREPLFLPRDGGVPRADVVECLLDLYEARLGSQADEFMAALEGGAAA